MRRLRLLLLVPAVLLHAANAPVRVWQGTLTLPTYQEGAPDVNPPFDLLETQRFNYPYTLRENLTGTRVNETWRAIYIENEYLKCSVLPDLGGHLYTCVDKLSGQPMFYANPSIKKANIGYRGAWAAFGIEFNFPISHNWVSMSPVDFAYSTHPDNSASITVGNIDRVYGMQWSVEMILRPRATVLEERVTLSNRSDVRHRFYWWNNAAVRVWDDSRIQYPMRYAASHGFTEVQPWPVDATGKDLSVIRSQTDGPVSLFVHGSREPYMAVWQPHNNTGVVHFADYAELPGKKIWSWGADADALDWRNALSDDNSAYVEVQSGLFRNQETYAFLQPRQTIRFSEYWIPARDLGGIARANLTGVANLARQGNNLRASFNANSDIPHARIRLLDGARVLLEEHVDLTPAHTWKRQIAILDTCHAYTFELVDAAGALRLRHTEGEYDWTPQDQVHVGPQPAYHMPPAQQRTEDDWLALGEEEERDGKTLLAFSVYQEALQHFSQSFELRKAAGRVAACLLRYEDAVHYLSPLAERDVSDPEIAYYLAFGWENLGDERNARTFYERAYRFPEFRAAASLHLGEMDARAAQLEKAAQRLAISVDAAPSDPRAVEEWTAVQNALGKTDSARRLARQALARDPLSNFVREELGEPDLAHLGADPNRLLYIAAQYMRLGMYRAASRVLSRAYPRSPAQESEPGSVQPQQHVLVAYFNAYCRERLGEPAAQEYERASRLSTLYVFPAGAEALEVLKAAVRNNDSDATAHYLLGTFLFAQGEVNQALVEWQRANKLAPSLPVIDADIGRALLHLKNDPQGALTAFRGGISADSKNTALYTGIDQALSILKHPHTERVQELSRYPDLAHIPSDLLYELILNRAEAGDFEGAVDLFRNRFFPRQEGGTNVRQVWLEVRLQQALSLAKSDHCDAAISAAEQAVDPVSGFAFTNDGVQPLLRAARPQYILGVITERCGRQREARQHFENARQQTDTGQIFWAYAAARKLDENAAAQWRPKLKRALEQAIANSETSSYTSLWVYDEALLESALGQADADATFVRALLLPDRMLAHHLTRLARAQLIPE